MLNKLTIFSMLELFYGWETNTIKPTLKTLLKINVWHIMVDIRLQLTVTYIHNNTHVYYNIYTHRREGAHSNVIIMYSCSPTY